MCLQAHSECDLTTPGLRLGGPGNLRLRPQAALAPFRGRIAELELQNILFLLEHPSRIKQEVVRSWVCLRSWVTGLPSEFTF